MSVIFQPSGILDIAQDASDLPESSDGRNISSDGVVLRKNLRVNQRGQAKTRDGSTKLNSTALGQTAIYWIEEQSGTRYTFAGTVIYENESSIKTGLTSAQWSAIQYNSYNDTVNNIFALNGTDRQRIESSTAYEWGLAAPTTAPTLIAGPTAEDGLTGSYNAKYTYLRKVSGVVVAESNPSPAADLHIALSGNTLIVGVTSPSDSQVTHIRLYRTTPDGALYYQDQDTTADTYAYGISHSWEDGYLSGDSYKFSVTDSTNSTDDTYAWEPNFSSDDSGLQDFETDGTDSWYAGSEADYINLVIYLLNLGIQPPSYEEFLAIY